MINILKKHDFPLRIERFFTRATDDPFDLIPFDESVSGEEDIPFKAPNHWSAEATAAFAAEASCHAIPSATRAIEENTVPSWLWRRVSDTSARVQETSARQVFHRAAGAAAYAGWKQGVFADENEAQAFFDEIRYLLAQRFIALDPSLLARSGIDWAYGIENKVQPLGAATAPVSFEAPNAAKQTGAIEIRNASIDALLGGDKKIGAKWEKMFGADTKSGFIDLRFADIANDWSITPQAPANAALDLFLFRRDDGSFDGERLAQAVRLLAILLELTDGAPKAIGFHNLATLLMSQGLAYNSDAGRATAAAIAAIITAESCVASAQMAALLGPSLDFAANHEAVLRVLRNHRRAAYGDRNDYEKISVLPVPLTLEAGADLAFVAAARRRWDDALELARQHGLRTIHFTDLSMSLSLAHFMEATSPGIAAMPALTVMQTVEEDLYRQDIHPAVTDALIKLGYNAEMRKTITQHIAGALSLEHAPGLDHSALRRKGFDDRALEDIENYLPYTNDIRFAFTPWIVGETLYREVFKIPDDKMRDPRFDLLSALGFSAAAIKTANDYCYGTGSARGAKSFAPAHVAVLAQADEISAEAQIRMAASIQSFVSGDTGLTIRMENGAKGAEQLLLAAWRQGVKSAAVEFKSNIPSKAEASQLAASMQSKKPPAGTAQTYAAPTRSILRGKAKAQGKLVSHARGKSGKSERQNKP